MSQTRMRAYRFTLDPRDDQVAAMVRHAGAARRAYNYALATIEGADRRQKLIVDELVTLGWTTADAQKIARTRVPLPGRASLAGQWRKERHHVSPWWPDVSSYVFSSAFANARQAYSNYIASCAGTRAGPPVGRPRFKRKNRCRDSFTIYHDVKKPTIRVETYRRLHIPRIGSVRIHDTAKPLAKRVRAGTAQVKSATISRGAHRWHASVLVEEDDDARQPTRAQRKTGPVGVDAGVTYLVALSDGATVANPRHLKVAQAKLDRAQRTQSRRQRGSKRRQQASQRVARLHHEVAEARRSHLHQITARLAKSWQTVVVEDLNLAGMTRRPEPKPDPGTPGQYLPNRAAAKAGLNRALSDSSLGELRRQLEYKTTWYGSTLIPVNPQYTSQTCSECGHTVDANRETQARFVCKRKDCGHTQNADINAARNILARGLADEKAESINAHLQEMGRPSQQQMATGTEVIQARPTPT